VISYDPATGQELWRVSCLSGEIAPSPCFAGGMVFVAMEGAGIKAIRLPAKPEIKTGQIAWSADDGAPDTVSPASDGQFLIVVNSAGLVTCYDAQAGKKLWEKDLQTPVSATPVFVGKSVYLTDEKGLTHIFEAGPVFKGLGSGEVGEAVRATPAFVGGKIYLRGEKTLFALGSK
jgi:outer membrane protein assembly factor BamB